MITVSLQSPYILRDHPSVLSGFTSVNPEHFIVQNHAERENIVVFFSYIETISQLLGFTKIV